MTLFTMKIRFCRLKLVFYIYIGSGSSSRETAMLKHHASHPHIHQEVVYKCPRSCLGQALQPREECSLKMYAGFLQNRNHRACVRTVLFSSMSNNYFIDVVKKQEPHHLTLCSTLSTMISFWKYLQAPYTIPVSTSPHRRWEGMGEGGGGNSVDCNLEPHCYWPTYMLHTGTVTVV